MEVFLNQASIPDQHSASVIPEEDHNVRIQGLQLTLISPRGDTDTFTPTHAETKTFSSPHVFACISHMIVLSPFRAVDSEPIKSNRVVSSLARGNMDLFRAG